MMTTVSTPPGPRGHYFDDAITVPEFTINLIMNKMVVVSIFNLFFFDPVSLRPVYVVKIFNLAKRKSLKRR